MDFLHTLLSFSIALLMALGTLVNSALTDEQKTTTLPPLTSTSTSLKSATTVATSSSQSILALSAVPAALPSKKPEAKPVSSTPIAPTTPIIPSPPASSLSAEALNTQTRGALVNILCIANGGGVHSISGSGVFIDSRGVILTNAHVGQYFLLKDYPTQDNVDCTIRIGSPAMPRYRATLLYLPPTWVAENASQLVALEAKGTGENDYAFLLITGPTGPGALPAAFPKIPMTTMEPNTNDAELLAAYPAGFLDGSTIEKSLYPTSAYAMVKDLFTFGTGNDVDLVSIGGTIVSQGGSSGGAAVRVSDGELQGIVATATAGKTTAERDLRAITIAHIERSLIAQGQGGFVSLLSQNLTEAAAHFASTVAPGEKDLLVKAVEHR